MATRSTSTKGRRRSGRTREPAPRPAAAPSAAGARGAKSAVAARPDPSAPLAAPATVDVAVPSSLALSPHGSAARSGRARLEEQVLAHQETGPALTGGDVDADWVAAYSVGDESPGGDNPTPGQTVVDEFGRALGLGYGLEEELRGPERVAERDRHRWELDPASSEDFADRGRPEVKAPSPAGTRKRKARRSRRNVGDTG